ncbi:hypothetical protein [Streptomyces sp. WMMB 322]|uniref:hypothetical protein n=1 Tax=Streptomyces sp. WMMB 322 TaxID=1286821 RepID=UPI0020C7CB7F|nr:hypothetical protein [Streptomyces sp. WMMB 322]
MREDEGVWQVSKASPWKISAPGRRGSRLRRPFEPEPVRPLGAAVAVAVGVKARGAVEDGTEVEVEAGTGIEAGIEAGMEAGIEAGAGDCPLPALAACAAGWSAPARPVSTVIEAKETAALRMM